ncbi:DPCD protein [Strigomonas culicis]|nr:DPCD protein [Strigomonas culicis]|eukprot:EPY33299.1 DPCD protein [Strigomonas culicis]
MSATLAEPKTSVIVDGRKRITSVFTDGSEMIEEFDVVTDELLLRKRRAKGPLGGYGKWTTEVGTEARSHNVESALIVESSGSPVVVRQDTKEAHVFRIRNLPYPKSVFAVTIERSGEQSVGEIVVRTSNKKYFKRLEIPDMQRAKIPLDPANLSYDVKHNTLVIEYKKHLAVLAAENVAKKERSSMPAKRLENENAQCPQQ